MVAGALGIIVHALLATNTANGATFPPHLTGNVSAVYALLERVIPGSSSNFELSISGTCEGIPAGKACFTLADTPQGKISVAGTSASEISGGIGVYLREYCGMTIGWERGGGSNIFSMSPWPSIGRTAVSQARSVPYSHVTQVCTHSYTLVWHGWPEWEAFIDWMALAGHNSIIAPTGQEEVQYKVLTEQFGLSDMAVRNWTNGPAWLTWSRGQNRYAMRPSTRAVAANRALRDSPWFCLFARHGNGIGGPTPRSFMKGQWDLQKRILKRYRELGIAGHQPAFGGYAPWALAAAQNDTRITRGKPGLDFDTGWIDGRDPLYTEIADAWMKQIISDFGSDHVWQVDAFFGNGTGWGSAPHEHQEPPEPHEACEWSSAMENTYLKGCAHANSPDMDSDAPAIPTTADLFPPCPSFASVAEAKSACGSNRFPGCSGVTTRSTGQVELRAGSNFIPVPVVDNETSYKITNMVSSTVA